MERMNGEQLEEARSDLEVAICGPRHTGWCKYCRARHQIHVSVNEEREACAELAEGLIDPKDETDWHDGFNMACRMLIHIIRAHSSHTSAESLARSFKKLSQSIAASQAGKALAVSHADHADNCCPSEPSLFSSIGTPAH